MPFSIATSGIVAEAFRLMEMSPPSSFGDDSEEAAAAEEQYLVALDMCLEDAEWSFATRTVRLPAVDEAPTDSDLPHAFMRPADLVKIQKVRRCTRWRLDADRLRADRAGPLEVRYTFRIADEGKGGGNFRTAVSYTLAGLLAPRWTTSANRSTDFLEKAERFLATAAKADRGNASAERYDGREADHDDWAEGAVA